jgi:hypothetical protein
MHLPALAVSPALPETHQPRLPQARQQPQGEQLKESGITFASLLGIVFIVLKLVGVISWSWWWVLAPFWTPLALAVLLIGGGLLLIWLGERR